MSNPILRAENIFVSFDNHTILDNLSFEVERDTTVAIVGQNGSGKTVLFKTLLNLIPYQGEVLWEDGVVIGYVPQKLSVSNDLPVTVSEFLELKEPDNKKTRSILELVGFKIKAEHIHHDLRVMDTKLGSLSGGELQRVLIAYALLGDPNVLLLDEPTAGVDLEGEETFYSLFRNLKKDKDLTIIFISHDKNVVEKYADRVIKLSHEH